MPTFVSGLTSNAPVANGTARNAVVAKGATVAVSGYSNPVALGGSTAPYIGVAALPPLPTTGQLWPPLN